MVSVSLSTKSERPSSEGVKTPMQLLIPEISLGLARRILAKEAPTAVVYEIVDNLLGHTRNDIDAWQPETIWKELERMGINLDVIQKDQVMAVTALRSMSNLVFLTGYEFKNVILPVNHEVPMIDIDEVVDVEHIAWCVRFMQEYLPEKPFFVDYGALEYVARILHDEGFFVPPSELEFAASRLTQLNKNAYDYADMVRDRLKGGNKKQNPLIDAQMKKLGRVEHYVGIMLDAHRGGLKRLVKG